MVGPTCLAYDKTTQLSTYEFHFHILRRLFSMRGHTDKTLTMAEVRYKKHFDGTVCSLSTVEQIQQVFVYRATMARQSPSQRLTEAEHTQLRTWSTRLRTLR